MTSSPLSAVDRAYEFVREAVLTGQYSPGDMTSEPQIANSLGISRTPVRSALTKLQDDGWIAVYPRRGALVKGLTEREVREPIEVQFVFESTSVTHICRDNWTDLLVRLRTNIASQKDALASADLDSFIDHTVAFHRMVVEAGCNSIMPDFDLRLSDRRRFLLYSYGERLLARCADIIDEHERLVACLESGASDEFAQVLEHHLTHAYRRAEPRH